MTVFKMYKIGLYFPTMKSNVRTKLQHENCSFERESAWYFFTEKKMLEEMIFIFYNYLITYYLFPDGNTFVSILTACSNCHT